MTSPPIAAADALRTALADAQLALENWFKEHPTLQRVTFTNGPELRYAPESQLVYLDAEGFAFLSGDEHLVEHFPYWMLDGEDLILCLNLLTPFEE